jgi:Stress responsive A/B Barrel Domain
MENKYVMRLLRIVLLGFVNFGLIPMHSEAQKDTAKAQKIQQVEIVTFKTGVSEQNQHLVDASFRHALNQLPLMHTFLSVVGDDNENSGHVKHVYITTFNNKGDLNTYNASPQHQAAKKTNSAYIDTVITVNYPVGK